MTGAAPARIGPYRLESRLGGGGMGEVYRAWDERLERWVAVKLIRPEAAGDPRARERFRREARAAAGLSHPAVVQIHDVVFTEPADAIVMELVEGSLLSDLIARGPLELALALRLAAQIAEGLAAAHGQGVVHRDLKPENVMVDAWGRAKILDFGLAKRPGGEASLTQDQMVVGTYRSMSPEQARGLEVDHRSDLFSLGTLLYEMLTGRSPFLGPVLLETLTRICTFRQAPVRELRPEVPAPLSDLVDRLLRKDPARRPQSTAEVAQILAGIAGPSPATPPEPAWSADPPTVRDAPALPAAASDPLSTYHPLRWRHRRTLALAAAALAVVAAWVFGLSRWGGPAPLYVAVPKPEVTSTGDTGEGADLMAASLRGSLLRGLLALEEVHPLAAEQVDPVSGPPVRLAQAVAADEVVTAQMSCDVETCRISLQRLRGEDGGLVWTQDFAAPLRRPFLLNEAVQGHLRNGYRERGLRPGSPRLEVREEDYAEYLRLSHDFSYNEEEDRSLDDLLARLQTLRSRSPGFPEAYLLSAELLGYRFQSRRDPADLEAASALLRQARDMAPGDPRPLFGAFQLALAGGRLDAAAAAVDELEILQPGDPAVAVRRARLLERQGRAGEALERLREAVERRPSWTHLLWLAEMESRAGQGEAARRHLEEVLRRLPDHYTAASMLAQMELLNGSPERAAELYAGLVRRSPQPTERVNLALAQMLLGRYGEAEAGLRRAVAMEPRNALFALNLADVLQLQGREAEARQVYRQVLELVARDPAGSHWQLLTVHAQALAHLGRRREAVEVLQRALGPAQANNQAAYEASLVYTLVGDLSSAAVYAAKALEQGVGPRWFSFPWFAPLRPYLDRGLLVTDTSPQG